MRAHENDVYLIVFFHEEYLTIHKTKFALDVFSFELSGQQELELRILNMNVSREETLSELSPFRFNIN